MLFIAGGIIAGCSTDKSANPTVQPDAAYPSAIGTQWVYSRVNEVWDIRDTFTITIESDSIAPDGARILIAPVERGGSIIQTRRLRIMGDTVEWYTSHFTGWYLLERYVLPMQLGDKWKMLDAYQATDSMYVLDRDQVTVPFGRFPKAFVLSRRMTNMAGDSVLYQDDQYFVPGYGMVKSRQDDTQSEDLWELIDFETPQR